MAQIALSTKIELKTHLRLEDTLKNVEDSKAKMIDLAINEYLDKLEKGKVG